VGGETIDRRARKKAQTRDQIRRTAQRLFAERGFEAVTIADVAATADVAVQTVFNHFATKEELFFSGRVPFLHGPADAVRSRDTSTGPVTALRGYLLQRVESYVRGAGNPRHRQLVATLAASPSLRSHERLLQQQAEENLRAALVEAWEQPTKALDDFVPTDPQLAARVISVVWLGTVRAVLVMHRDAPPEQGDDAAVATAVRTAEHLLDRIERLLEPLPGDVVVRRAS
jgi:AcrR family transcriptional regulator